MKQISAAGHVTRLLLIAAIALAYGSVLSADEKSEKATDFFQRGERAYFIENYQVAIDWYERAAELGSLDAKGSLALMYATGRGVEKDRAKASAWYRKMLKSLRLAARNNNIEALRTLAYMYRHGLGVTKSGISALRFYERAAELGDLDSMRDISGIYDAGILVTRNLDEAVKWLRRAAEWGDARSMQQLGDRYLAGGERVPKDRAEAIRWYQTAADFGDKKARRQLKLLGMPQIDPLKLYSSSGDKLYTLVRYHGVRVDLSCFILKENCLALRAVDQVRSKKIQLPKRAGASPNSLMCSAVGGRWQVLRDSSRKEFYLCSFFDKTLIDSRDLYNARLPIRR
ncbi:MAG: tetratricopeptide repeat protein [Acidiferrobacterales bacterium]